MLISFNPVISNNKSNRQSPNFKSLKDGKIVAEEVAKHTNAAAICGRDIYTGAYKPTVENLQALLKAKKIAATNPHEKISLVMRLDEAIEALKKKATEAGIKL